MAKYELRPMGDDLAYVRLEDDKLPLRALGFLQFEGKKHEKLVCWVKEGRITIWVEEEVFKPKGK
jgi:hypothetical protein